MLSPDEFVVRDQVTPLAAGLLGEVALSPPPLFVRPGRVLLFVARLLCCRMGEDRGEETGEDEVGE
jgi:hypothetical protein